MAQCDPGEVANQTPSEFRASEVVVFNAGSLVSRHTANLGQSEHRVTLTSLACRDLNQAQALGCSMMNRRLKFATIRCPTCVGSKQPTVVPTSRATDVTHIHIWGYGPLVLVRVQVGSASLHMRGPGDDSGSSSGF